MSIAFTFIHARTSDDIIDPAHTRGVEVTDPAVAVWCWLGNVDGQHNVKAPVHPGVNGCSYDGVELSRWLGYGRPNPAEGAAVAIATHVYVSPRGTTFATSRPDLDSIAAMAVIVIRAIGLWPNAGVWSAEPFGEEIALRDRVRMIAEADAFIAPTEWSPSPLPTEENPWPRAGSVDSRPEIAHLAAICSPRRGDLELPLAQRVAIVATWLLYGYMCESCRSMDNSARGCSACGDVNPIERHRECVDRICDACGVATAGIGTFDAGSILATIRDARTRVVESRRALAREARREGALYIVPGNMTEECIPYGSPRPEDVAIVRVAHAGAIGLGYCLAPVVVAFDASTPGKVTIACYNTRYLDVEGLLADLRERETGWGGNVRSGILGSPQNGGTKLRDDTIVNLVAKRLK